MKKTMAVILSAVLLFCFYACGKSENKADTSLKDGEIMLTGSVVESYGNSLLLEEEKDDGTVSRYFVTINDYTEFVVDGWYVTDLSADSFEGKKISVICNEMIMETYPAQLQDERMIIVLK